MIQLYVEDQLVDITESVGLYLNKKYEDVQNPTLYFCDYSKTISLPMTPRNKLIFDNYARQDSVVTSYTLDPRKRVPFKLLYNSKLVMEGFLKINNANTVISDNKFELELYSEFGLIMKELQELTFNKYECRMEGGEKDDKYFIPTPWSDTHVDRFLVKQSFEKQFHNTYGEDILDYIMFIPSYQGKYQDFSSDKIETDSLLLGNIVKDLPDEEDEHWVREFRSYYQQPALFVDKLWMMAKQKIEEITDYSFILDGSWFNSQNPYWNKLIYTCPSLYTKDDNFEEISSTFDGNKDHYVRNITAMGNLSQHKIKRLYFSPSGSLYENNIFNFNQVGTTVFSAETRLMLCAVLPNAMTVARNFKIRKDNPLFIKFYAVNAATNEPVPDASFTYMLYSENYNTNLGIHFDEKIDCGIVSTARPGVDIFPTGFDGNDGAWFSQKVNLTLHINHNVPYYICFDCWFANNSKAVEYANDASWNPVLMPRWDWLWNDHFWTKQPWHDTREGYFIFNNLVSANVRCTEHLRSGSRLDMYRIFPKETSLYKVLLNYSKMFGLMWDVDQDNKTITVMTRNRFFHNYKTLDWSKKIDRGHDFILEPLCFDKKYVSFNVEEGKGERYENYMSKFGTGYGTKKINTEYQFNTDTEELLEGIQPSMVCSKKQSSIIYNTTNPNNDDFVGYNFKVQTTEHYIENDNGGENAGNWGQFYFFNGSMDIDPKLGRTSNEGYPVVYVTDDTGTQVKFGDFMWNNTSGRFLTCSKLPDISTITNDGHFSVHFEKPREYYFNAPASTRYIYPLYWSNYIDERYNVQNKKLTCYVYMSPEEYGDIDFREFVKIDNTLYHINRIFDFDFDTNSPTKVELCQVWNIQAYTEGQSAFQSLSVSPDYLYVYSDESVTADVYSTQYFYVEEKPSWITYNIDYNTGRLFLRATSDPLRSRIGTVKVKSGNLSEIIRVIQRPDTNFFHINPNTALLDGDGSSITVAIDSNPNEISVFSCPDWCHVELQTRRYILQPVEDYRRELVASGSTTVPIGDQVVTTIVPFEERRRRTDRGNDMNITQIVKTFAKITADPNTTFSERSGTIRFYNCMMYKDFNVRQTTGTNIPLQRDETPIEVSLNDSGTFELRCGLELDKTTVGMTRGTVNNFVGKIDNLSITFNPTLDDVDHGDGTPETCTGGQISFVTADGRRISQNYNYGSSLYSYPVVINVEDSYDVRVNGVLYTSTFYDSFDEGTVITVECVPHEGNEFVKWSDGVTTASRSVTVNSEVRLTCDVLDDNYLYDNSDIVDFDDTTAGHVIYGKKETNPCSIYSGNHSWFVG